MAVKSGDRSAFVPQVYVLTVDGVRLELDLLDASYINIDQEPIDFVSHLVTDVDAHQPDLISYNAYGDESYWWLIMQFNRVFDPYRDVVSGMTLKIPNASQAFQILYQRVNDRAKQTTATFTTI